MVPFSSTKKPDSQIHSVSTQVDRTEIRIISQMKVFRMSQEEKNMIVRVQKIININ